MMESKGRLLSLSSSLSFCVIFGNTRKERRRIHLKFKELSWNERRTIKGIYMYFMVFFSRSDPHHLLCESLRIQRLFLCVLFFVSKNSLKTDVLWETRNEMEILSCKDTNKKHQTQVRVVDFVLIRIEKSLFFCNLLELQEKKRENKKRNFI
jgi:hypothetical protein